MSYTSQDWRLAITNLIKLTSKGEIKWERSDLYRGDSWTEVLRSFQCKIGDKIYVVSSTRSKSWIDESEYVWSPGYDFTIYENNFEAQPIGSAPADLNIVRSLFDTVEQSFVFLRRALDGLL